jgi:hypothetical protein
MELLKDRSGNLAWGGAGRHTMRQTTHNELMKAGGVGRHDRPAKCQRFHDGEGLCFVVAQQHDHSRTGHQVSHS